MGNTGKHSQKSEAAKREERVLVYWKQNDIFKKSKQKESPKGEFVFYDGPPFATGLPHYGSLLSSVIKDVIPRYKTMRGFHVRRRWGWDCHGLPIENMVEKELGLKTKKDIENLGVAKFNAAAREAVLRCADDWKHYVDRIGRWVEFDNAYKTMDNTYIESVWWALSQINKKELLYEGRKVLLYCPRCETPLAKAEIAMDHSYKEITEEAITIAFQAKEPDKNNLPQETYLLAWTTTPWTLPGNVALAVGGGITYALVEQNDKHFILAKELIRNHFGEEANIVKELKAKDLVGLFYTPLFDVSAVSKIGKDAWYVAEADFVSTEEGTGIVHTAVMYGEDDFELGKKLDLPMVPLLDKSGHFNADAPHSIQGMYFKRAEDTIKDELKKKGLLFSAKNHTHSYPHCYRCDTQLFYNALSSWFIAIEKIRKNLLAHNEEISWFPAHLKYGRFKNIIENAPDWNISRNRYWASPLPIWKCEKCPEQTVVGSLSELKEKMKKSGNRYFVMRHGPTEANGSDLVSVRIKNPHPLTEIGKEMVKKSAEQLKKENIDVIIASPFVRTKETAGIVAGIVGTQKNAVIIDERIRELDAGDFEGKHWSDYEQYFNTPEERFTKAPPGGETLADENRRVMDFLYDLEKKYSSKNILIVSHASPISSMLVISRGEELTRPTESRLQSGFAYKTAEAHELPFAPLPRREDGEFDMHRPYIDDVVLVCGCGGDMKRIPEVFDCWFESGSMPFAEYHYPFEHKKDFEKRSPADFIAEYIAQTRTWFYYMHAVAVLLFDSASFKNVVTTGNILAEDGSKMSKSKGNYTDPQENFDQFGADALRYYLMTNTVMQAEDIRFLDGEIREAHNRVINIFWNTFQFFNLYAGAYDGKSNPRKSRHVLDQWILARLDELVKETTNTFDAYNTIQAGRAMRGFIEDFSTWFIRRSRDRFKGGNEADKQYAIATTRFVLLELSKIIAPITPFVAETVYLGVSGEKEKKSVHLEDWPLQYRRLWPFKTSILEEMAEVRRIVSFGLEARAEAGIKVRQPLSSLTVRQIKKKDEQLLRLIKDEVNVKDVLFDESMKTDVRIDAEITPELKEEGIARELIRRVQTLRKEKGLTPKDNVILSIETNELGQKLIGKFQQEMMETALLSSIQFAKTEGEMLEEGEYMFIFTIV